VVDSRNSTSGKDCIASLLLSCCKFVFAGFFFLVFLLLELISDIGVVGCGGPGWLRALYQQQGAPHELGPADNIEIAEQKKGRVVVVNGYPESRF
jgi:hypothetical protein